MFKFQNLELATDDQLAELFRDLMLEIASRGRPAIEDAFQKLGMDDTTNAQEARDWLVDFTELCE